MAWDSTYHPKDFRLCGVTAVPYFGSDWSFGHSETYEVPEDTIAYIANTFADLPTSTQGMALSLELTKLLALKEGDLARVMADETSQPAGLSTLYRLKKIQNISLEQPGDETTPDSPTYRGFTWQLDLEGTVSVSNPYSFYLPPEDRYYTINDFNYNWHKLSSTLYKAFYQYDALDERINELSAYQTYSQDIVTDLIRTRVAKAGNTATAIDDEEDGGTMLSPLFLPVYDDNTYPSDGAESGYDYAITKGYVDREITATKGYVDGEAARLDTRITNVENLGSFVGSYDTNSQLPSKNDSLPGKIITINDFATVKGDTSAGRVGQTSRYVVSSIAQNGNITWAYDIPYSTDVTSKQDKSTANYSLGTSNGEWQVMSSGQIGALNSGITHSMLDQVNGHLSDGALHLTAGDKEKWDSKQDELRIEAGAGIGIAESTTEGGGPKIVITNNSPNKLCTWNEIPDKPETFPPSGHNHTMGNITGPITLEQLPDGFSLSEIEGTIEWDRLTSRPGYLHNQAEMAGDNYLVGPNKMVGTDDGGKLCEYKTTPHQWVYVDDEGNIATVAKTTDAVVGTDILGVPVNIPKSSLLSSITNGQLDDTSFDIPIIQGDTGKCISFDSFRKQMFDNSTGAHHGNLSDSSYSDVPFIGSIDAIEGSGPTGYSGEAFMLNIPSSINNSSNCLQLVIPTDGEPSIKDEIFYRTSLNGTWRKIVTEAVE